MAVALKVSAFLALVATGFTVTVYVVQHQIQIHITTYELVAARDIQFIVSLPELW